MKTAAWLSMVVSGGLFAAGCASAALPVDPTPDAGPVADDAAVDAAIDDAATTPTPSPLAHCDIQRAWWSADTMSAGMSAKPFLGFSPNGGMLYRGRGAYRAAGQYLRGSSGAEMMVQTEPSVVLARDAHWGREVSWSEPDAAMRVATVLTRRMLMELPSETNRYWLDAALTDDGSVLTVEQCTPEGIAMRSFTVDDAHERTAIRFDGAMCNGGYGATPVVLPLDRDVVLAALPGDGTLYRLDFSTSTRTAVTITDAVQDPNTGNYGGPILAVAASPDRTRIATVSIDGKLRQWSLPDLAPLGAAIDAGSAVLNQYVYAYPFRVSPLAFSPAGDLLAFLEPDGSVGILRLADGTVLGGLRAPDDGWMGQPGRGFPVAALSFSPDGATLAASFDGGSALWECTGHTFPSPQDSLGVTITGPASVHVGDTAALEATHMGTEHVHSHQFFIDGEAMGAASLDRNASWTASGTGTHDVRVVIDDGVNTGHATMNLVVQ